MASRFETFAKDETSAINKAVIQTNTTLSRPCLLVGRICNKSGKNHLTKSPKCLKIVNKVPTK